MFFLKNYLQAYIFAVLLFAIILLGEIQTSSLEDFTLMKHLFTSIFPKSAIYAVPLAGLMWCYSKFELERSLISHFVQIISFVCISLVTTFLQKFLEFYLGTWDESLSFLSFIKNRFFSTWLGLNIYAIIYGSVVTSIRNMRKNIILHDQLKSLSINAMKNQLEHHFLFNNLNTLYSLIDIKNEKALNFLHDLSELYRYLLINVDNKIVPVSEEMAIVQKYINLIHERFGVNLIFKINYFAESLTEKVIPPLSVYNLVENVIKHNVIDNNHPIACTIEVSENYISVSNNIERKKQFFGNDNYGIGISSLKEIYYLISKKDIEIKDTGKVFTVQIPVLDMHEIII